MKTGDHLHPRQRVVAFKDCHVSGATIGYHGTIVARSNSSVRLHPERPDLWEYRVYIPYFGHECQVPARDLLPTGDHDCQDDPPAPESPVDDINMLCFYCVVALENDKIWGAYRKPGKHWCQFTFERFSITSPSYKLHAPVTKDGISAASLLYNVPWEETLDKEYVLHALEEITGVHEWQSVRTVTGK